MPSSRSSLQPRFTVVAVALLALLRRHAAGCRYVNDETAEETNHREATRVSRVSSDAHPLGSCDNARNDLRKITLRHDGGVRHYFLHASEELCERLKAGTNRVPPRVLFALHCFGCTAEMFAEAFTEMADRRGFVVVAPVGIGRSWNAGACCGRALMDDVDDVGFLCAVTTHLKERVLLVDAVDAFALGWSNGGFLAARAALAMPSLFRAIVPVSGYQYDVGAIETRSMAGDGHPGDILTGAHAVPIFMHHSRDDPMVRFEGCCDRQETPCCCDISKHGRRDGACVGADQAWREWARDVNGCGTDGVLVRTNPAAAVGDLALEEDEGREVSGRSDVGMTCVEATDCVARSIFCAHEGAGHFSHMGFHEAFPMRMKLAAFEFFDEHASDAAL